MKILHVVPTYYPAVQYGGPIYAIHSLCKALANLGHEVHVVTTSMDGDKDLDVPIGQAVDLDNVKITYFRSRGLINRLLFRAPLMERYLKENIEKYDFVHLHSVYLWPTYIAARLAYKFNICYCISPRGALVPSLIRKKGFFKKKLALLGYEYKNIANAAFIHATSELESLFIREMRIKYKEIEVLPNGVDFTPSNLVAKRLDRPYILYIGRISWKKSLDKLIMAMPNIGGVDLIIAGNDELGLRAKLEMLSHKMLVSNRVRFIGPVYGEKKIELLKGSEMLVLPSQNENFGNVVLESWMCGRPVAVTQGVGLAPVAVENHAGIIISGDPQEMGRQIGMAILDSKKLDIMGLNGRQLVINSYSWIAIASLFIDKYMNYKNMNSDKFKLGK